MKCRMFLFCKSYNVSFKTSCCFVYSCLTNVWKWLTSLNCVILSKHFISLFYFLNKCLAIDSSKSLKTRFFVRKNIKEKFKTTRYRKQSGKLKLERCTASSYFKLGEDFRALPRYGCSGNGPYFGPLEPWTPILVHLCLFVSSVIWVSKSLKLDVNSIGCEILFSC